MTPLEVAPVTLAGRTVRLEPLALGHAEGLEEAARDPRIFAYLSMDLSRPGQIAAWLKRALAAQVRGEELPFAIVGLADGRLAGSMRYMNIAAPHRRLEIGWIWLAPCCWGGPFNTEGNLLLLGHAFETLGAHRVEYRADALNLRSQRAIEALGAVREGTFRRHMVMREDRVRDTVQFAIVDEDWPRTRVRIEARLARLIGAH